MEQDLKGLGTRDVELGLDSLLHLGPTPSRSALLYWSLYSPVSASLGFLELIRIWLKLFYKLGSVKSVSLADKSN